MEFILEFLGAIFFELLFEKISSPIFAITGASFRWLINLGKLRFTDICSKSNNITYGVLIWFSLIITIMFYFIFKK